MSMDLSLKGWGGSFFEENATEESDASSSDEEVVSGGGKPVPGWMKPADDAPAGAPGTPAAMKAIERKRKRDAEQARYDAKQPVSPHKSPHKIG
jgi:hypothetical protein